MGGSREKDQWKNFGEENKSLKENKSKNFKSKKILRERGENKTDREMALWNWYMRKWW